MAKQGEDFFTDDLLEEIGKEKGAHIFDSEKGEFVDELPKDEPPKDEPPKDKLPEDEPPEDEPPEDEPPKDEPPKDELPEEMGPELKKFNEIFGTEHKKWDDVDIEGYKARDQGYTELKERADKSQGFEDKNKTLQEQVEVLEKSVNPRNWFANEAEFMRQVYLKKHPDLNPDTLSKIAGLKDEEIKNMDPLDMLRMVMSLEYGDIYSSKAEINEAIEEKFEIDLDESLEKQGSLKRNKILVAAKEAAKKVNKIRGDTELPDEFNFEAKQAKLKDKQEKLRTDWAPFVKEVFPKELKTLKWVYQTKDGKKVVVDYEVDKKYIDEVVGKTEATLDYLSKNGFEFTDKNKDALIAVALKTFEEGNREKINTAMVNDVLTKLDLKTFEEIHNPKKLKRHKEAPKKKTEIQEQHSKADAELMDDLDGKGSF